MHGESIFWLKGIVGTGESTISRTLAQEFQDQGKLAATFLFKRGEGDRGNASKFFSTLVVQLVRHLPLLEPHIRRVLDDEPTVISKNMKEQFEKLFLQPLVDTELQASKISSIVIDALDECDNDGHIRLILQLLGSLHAQSNLHIRIFITS